MAKIKLSKNELKKQKETLQRFTRFLPTLQLKKQQLQFEIVKIDHAAEETQRKIEQLNNQTETWVDVFAEEVGLEKLFEVEVLTGTGNVAGVDIPVLKEVKFTDKEYDLMLTPVWVDRGIEVSESMIKKRVELTVFKEQRKVLEEELRITTQRVNLFEKIKIPEAKENIRVIRIYLGDLQTAEVVRGKIAKAKISKKAVLL